MCLIKITFYPGFHILEIMYTRIHQAWMHLHCVQRAITLDMYMMHVKGHLTRGIQTISCKFLYLIMWIHRYSLCDNE